jgi:hypothetical protein
VAEAKKFDWKVSPDSFDKAVEYLKEIGLVHSAKDN